MKFPCSGITGCFHVDDITGIPEDKIPKTEIHDHEFDPIANCEQLVEFWKDSSKIKFGFHQAAYFPLRDEVQMPNPRTFFEDEKYYSVLFHELTHSTDHRSRTNRHEKFPDHKFSSKDYSQEELVAEMDAAYLCGICGIENKTIDNSAACIQSWLKKLKSDNKLLSRQRAMHRKRWITSWKTRPRRLCLQLLNPKMWLRQLLFHFAFAITISCIR